MKKKLLPLVFILLMAQTKAQNFAINISGAAANPSSLLDLDATGMSPRRGLLIPRVTAAEKAAMNPLPAAAQGLLIYQTDGVQGFYYNTSTSTTPAWTYLTASGTGWLTSGNTGTNSGSNFIGTTDNVSLRIRTNNTENMVIDSNGTVGLGSTSPNSLPALATNRLELWDNTGSRSDLTLRVASGNFAGINFLGHTGTLAVPTATAANAILGQIVGNSRTNAGAYASAAAIRFSVDGTPGANDAPGNISFMTTPAGSVSVSQRMVIDRNGNVGIGTAAPFTKLDVNGTTTLRNGGNSGSLSGDQIYFGFNGSTDYRHAIKTRHNSGANVGNAIDFYLWNQGTDAVNATGTKRVLTLDGSGPVGHVGIGVFSPGAELDVNGKVRTTSFQMTLGAANTFILQSDAAGNATWVNPNTIGGQWTTAGTDIYNNNTGKVGIGTTTPAQKLDVNGTTKTTNFQMTSGATNTFILQSDAAGNASWVSPNSIGGFWSASGSDIYNNNFANVGIGTNSPTQQLDVDGAGLFRNGNTNVGTTANQLLFSYNGTSDYRHAIKSRHNGGAQTGNALDFYVWKQGIDATTTTGTEKVLTIDGGGGNGLGGVGIGTATIPSESRLVLEGMSSTEGGELQLNSPTSGYSRAYFMDVFQDNLRILSGTNTGSSAAQLTMDNTGTVSLANGLNVATTVSTEKMNVNGNMMLLDGVDRSIYVRNATLHSYGDALTISGGSAGINAAYPANGGDLNLFAGNRYMLAVMFGYPTGGNVNIRSGANIDWCGDCPNGHSGGSIVFQIGANGYSNFEAARFSPDGYLGVGTTTPSYPIEVANNNTASYSGYGYLSVSGAGTYGGSSGSVPISIRAASRIVCSEFNAVSDARIKNIIGKTNNQQDLQTINNIGITNYTFIDTVGKSSRVMKKVIAQELEKIYPNAVNKMTDVIPDIYAMAEIHGGIVKIKNNLKKGDKVQLIFKKKKDLYEVLEADANSFRVNSEEDGKLFVFGKQVDDFRTVDYEALTTLNISATQQLAKENDVLKKQLEEQAASIEKLNGQVKAILQLLYANKAIVSAGSTQNNSFTQKK